MSKPKNVSVSVIQVDGELEVWNAKFRIKGYLPMKDGKVDETARKKIEKRIAKALEDIDFPED